MEGYCLRDDNFICENSGEYKPFDLINWKVSPATDLLLHSPDFQFSDENLPSHVKKEGKSYSLTSVLNTKDSWSKTKAQSAEEIYLNEQVVPDQHQGANHKIKRSLVDKIQNDIGKISSSIYCTKETKCIPKEDSIYIKMDQSALKGLNIPKNLSNSMFVIDNKEQVKREKDLETLPAKDLTFNLNHICNAKENVGEVKENNTSQENIPRTFALWNDLCSSEDTELSNDETHQVKKQYNERSPNEFVQPANFETDSKIKLEKNDIREHYHCKGMLEKNNILKMREKILKILKVKQLPRCKMVEYTFDSSQRLPSFGETFCPDLSKNRCPTLRKDIELPEVLQNVEETITDYTLTLLPDSDSESSDIEECQHTIPEQISEQIEELPETKIKTEPMESGSGTETKIENADTTSSTLAIDDELEKYLVSSIMLNDYSESNESHLPDLSHNIGSIFKSDGLNEETTMESVYHNLFSKADNGLQISSQEQNTNLNLLNETLLGNERDWPSRITQANMHTLYRNVYSGANDTFTSNQASSSKDLTNNMFYMSDPFINNAADFKAIDGLPDEIMHTDMDPFKFTNLVPKVEVVDSSLNYGF